MKLYNLPKSTTKDKKRIGRGYGSGKGGHTVGRGQKGQKTRSKVGLFFEGTKFRKSLIRRLPLLRGKGKLKPGKKPVIVNVKYLNLLPADSLVDIKALIKSNIIKEKEAKEFGVKILGEGKLGKALKVALLCSKGAREKIKKAGGKIVKLKIKDEKLKIKEEEKKAGKEKSVKISRKSVKSKSLAKIVKTKKKTKNE